MELDLGFALILVSTSLLTALAALLVVSYLPAWPRPKRVELAPISNEDTVFLFDEDFLVDATPRARRLLSQAPPDSNDWNRLTALLTPRFPDFSAEMARLAETGLTVLEEVSGHSRIRALWTGGVARISLLEGDIHADDHGYDIQSFASLQSELEILRDVAAQMPVLAWQQGSDGSVTWANRAYLALVERTLDEDEGLCWPLPALFDGDFTADPAPRRMSVVLRDGSAPRFDCITAGSPEAPLIFALSADATVQAEESLRNFRQTLTKTFAGLPTGLAIFNRARNLVMFNPALVDLCLLEPQFLTARPTLFAFLDRLREKQMIPEPKDYRSWREKMTRLEEEAANGIYEETWSLPSGQTYRVTGRPYPDGAVAFLIEDISSEMSLTRRFRAELEMSQAVLDSLEEAIAIFSPAGVLALSNAAYARFWGSDPSETLHEIGIHDAVRLWSARCGAAAFFDQARDFITGLGPREEIRATLALPDGRQLTCRLSPIAGGATLIGFAPEASKAVPARAALSEAQP